MSFLEWFSHFEFHPQISKFNQNFYLGVRTCEFFFVSLARAELWLLLNGLLILSILCFTSSMRQIFTPRMNSKWQFLPLFNILPFLEFQAFFIDKLLRCWCRVVFGIFLSILKTPFLIILSSYSLFQIPILPLLKVLSFFLILCLFL